MRWRRFPASHDRRWRRSGNRAGRLARGLAPGAYIVSLLASAPWVPYLDAWARRGAIGAHLLSYGVFYLWGAALALGLGAARRPLTVARGLALWAASVGGGALLVLLDDPPIERVHLPEYGLLACLFVRALPGQYSPRAACGVAWILACAVGLLDECWQLLIPSRIFDWRDVATNAASAAVGILLAAGCGWPSRPPRAS